MLRFARSGALVVALLLTLAACGNETGDSTTPTFPTLTAESGDSPVTTTTEPVDPEEAYQEYTACMASFGVELPDPDDGGGVISVGDEGAFDTETFDEASAECGPILDEAFGEFEMSPEQQAELMDQELAFAQCMRDNGLDWPDPSGNDNIFVELGDDIDPDVVNAAVETCMEESFGEGGFVIGGGTP